MTTHLRSDPDNFNVWCGIKGRIPVTIRRDECTCIACLTAFAGRAKGARLRDQLRDQARRLQEVGA